MPLHDIEYVLTKLSWMREQRIWPNGLRYLWTDAFGLVLLVSLYRDLHEEWYLDDAEALVRDVDRVLGRRRGIRIGEAPDRDGQYFHYLAMWLFALSSLSEHIPQYRARAIVLARDVHRAFVRPFFAGRPEERQRFSNSKSKRVGVGHLLKLFRRKRRDRLRLVEPDVFVELIRQNGLEIVASQFRFRSIDHTDGAL